MKKLGKRKLFLVGLLLMLFFQSKATHIVGGDIAVQWVSGNDYQITLTLFFDCINGIPGAFDDSVEIGIFDKATNVQQQAANILFTDSVHLTLGDTCYSPPNMCVRQQRYIGTVYIPNNSNGYYLSWHRCCRNGIIANITNPGASGDIFYTEIPDPALNNSSPTFVTYPDAYMCAGYPNLDNFTATDIDNDSLVYSLSDPLDCAVNGICGTAAGIGPGTPIPGSAPAPYGTISWQAPYSLTNIMGAASMSIDQNGILSTVNPPTLGIFVFCVKVEEFSRVTHVKLGEIRRDVQYSIQPCNFPSVNVVGSNQVCLGHSSTITASGGNNYLWNTGETTDSIIVMPTSVGTYSYAVTTTVNATCHLQADTVISVNSLPVVLTSPDVTICPNQSSTLNASGASTYVWSPAVSLNNANISNPVATPMSATSYSVTGTDANGCTQVDTVIVALFEEPKATAATSNIAIMHGQSATLTASGEGTYLWSTGETDTVITVYPAMTTDYCMTVTNANNCKDLDCITIRVADSCFVFSAADIYLPNAFSPNGDEENDVFKIYFDNIRCIKTFRFFIYDRWGEKVFNSIDPNFQWDGAYKDNSENTAVFVYYLKVAFITGEEITKQGNVSLIR